MFEKAKTGEWVQVGKASGHSNAVLRLDWAHPKFGMMLASCSLDNSVCIWEERESVDDRAGARVGEWSRRTTLSDSRGAVNDVAFSPSRDTMTLAAGSADGSVRIYTVENPKEQDCWQIGDVFAPLPGGAPVTCLSWNPSRFDSMMLVVGGECSSLAVWGQSPSLRGWHRLCVLPAGGMLANDVAWAPDAGRSYHLIASACRDAAPVGRAISHTAAGLSAGTVHLWRLTIEAEEAEQPGGEDDDDDDIFGAFADAGTSAPGAAATSAGAGGSAPAAAQFCAVEGVTAARECTVCASADGDCPEVWRLRWGVVGSLLATTGDDGIVRLWRRCLSGSWACSQEFPVLGGAAPAVGHGGAEDLSATFAPSGVPAS